MAGHKNQLNLIPSSHSLFSNFKRQSTRYMNLQCVKNSHLQMMWNNAHNDSAAFSNQKIPLYVSSVLHTQ